MLMMLAGALMMLVGMFIPEPMNGFSVVGLLLVLAGLLFHLFIVEPAQETVNQINRELDRE